MPENIIGKADVRSVTEAVENIVVNRGSSIGVRERGSVVRTQEGVVVKGASGHTAYLDVVRVLVAFRDTSADIGPANIIFKREILFYAGAAGYRQTFADMIHLIAEHRYARLHVAAAATVGIEVERIAGVDVLNSIRLEHNIAVDAAKPLHSAVNVKALNGEILGVTRTVKGYALDVDGGAGYRLQGDRTGRCYARESLGRPGSGAQTDDSSGRCARKRVLHVCANVQRGRTVSAATSASARTIVDGDSNAAGGLGIARRIPGYGRKRMATVGHSGSIPGSAIRAGRIFTTQIIAVELELDAGDADIIGSIGRNGDAGAGDRSATGRRSK